MPVYPGAFGPTPELRRPQEQKFVLKLIYKIVDTVTNCATTLDMIKSFRHKGLAELFEKGGSRKVRQDLQSRSLRRLDALNQTESLTELNVPGFNFHGLQGAPKRYSIHEEI